MMKKTELRIIRHASSYRSIFMRTMHKPNVRMNDKRIVEIVQCSNMSDFIQSISCKQQARTLSSGWAAGLMIGPKQKSSNFTNHGTLHREMVSS